MNEESTEQKENNLFQSPMSFLFCIMTPEVIKRLSSQAQKGQERPLSVYIFEHLQQSHLGQILHPENIDNPTESHNQTSNREEDPPQPRESNYQESLSILDNSSQSLVDTNLMREALMKPIIQESIQKISAKKAYGKAGQTKKIAPIPLDSHKLQESCVKKVKTTEVLDQEKHAPKDKGVLVNKKEKDEK